MCRYGFFCCRRKAIREYQASWNKRCHLLFCCMGHKDRNSHSFREIARLLSDFFRDLDVVPSDVIAGLVLLRRFQRLQREYIEEQTDNDTYQYLSGVAITPKTKFLDVNQPVVADEVSLLAHYMQFALSIYGWPMYMMTSNGQATGQKGCCALITQLRCCVWKRPTTIIEDNCCLCNYAALKRMLMERNPNIQVVYVTYHVGVGETPFLVSLDHENRSVVVAVRGTLSPQDVLTDLNAEGEPLPGCPEDWLAHKGMLQAALYIKRKLVDEGLLVHAFNYSYDRGTTEYGLVLVGHSLGAGTAAILAVLLRSSYPNLQCYAFSPPGGLLSLPAADASKSCVTSVILGKDVVPRIGLHQMEALRTDLIGAIKHSKDPKWKIIMGGVLCCPKLSRCCRHKRFSSSARRDPDDPRSSREILAAERASAAQWLEHRGDPTLHPSDSSIALTTHQPLYPPGRIVHIVRAHPAKRSASATGATLNGGTQVGTPEDSISSASIMSWTKRQRLRRAAKRLASEDKEPVYQALWADTRDFDRVLISPSMIHDHMPDRVLDALQKLLVRTGPTKPRRGSMLPETNLEEIEPLPFRRVSNQDRVSIDDLDAHALVDSWKTHSKLMAMPSTDTVVPLASPETLSEVSSVSTQRGSVRLKGGPFCSDDDVIAVVTSSSSAGGPHAAHARLTATLSDRLRDVISFADDLEPGDENDDFDYDGDVDSTSDGLWTSTTNSTTHAGYPGGGLPVNGGPSPCYYYEDDIPEEVEEGRLPPPIESTL